ncbi:endonuclease III [Nitrososphaera viennensis]|uniref:Endonuclease III n=3 Tax=Nitrososphaera viennensis TaxID=1034015 RepID=A0A060HPN5_9ARCH|nr:endonuclease III [Nitrososphaera viennensis]AIC15511.1 putative endonuclease III [Nitrososphaera viennensis EN76]UVS70398.1 endonuclease III [Nitrososphaera viennensis]
MAKKIAMMPMGEILRRMEAALYREKPPRLTALRGLQMEEQGDPFKILIGTILSARSRDENTTKVVNKLFAAYRTPAELASADLDDIKKLIHSIGFYNVKAARIKQVAQAIVEKFGGGVPSDIDKLLELPGVGRKTANCVLVYAFDKPAIPVDIHVHRISNRLGLVETKTPEKTEEELSRMVDRRLWTKVNDTFVMYGQNICLPVKPNCRVCDLKNMCRYYADTTATSFSSTKERPSARQRLS